MDHPDYGEIHSHLFSPFPEHPLPDDVWFQSQMGTLEMSVDDDGFLRMEATFYSQEAAEIAAEAMQEAGWIWDKDEGSWIQP